MELTAITKDTFREVVKREGAVLIEWWSPACGACRQFHPVFLKVAEAHPESVFATIDVSAEEYLAEYFEIMHTPALSVYRDGLLMMQKPGQFDRETLESILEQVASLDMDQVRADLEAEES
jgi:thioredoxin 1